MAPPRVLYDRERWITIGAQQANPLTLYAQDWVGDYCDNPRGLSHSTARGHWNVIADREGVYEVEIRRWPRESNKSLTEGWEGPDDQGPSARPIASASLNVAGQHQSVDVGPGDTHATFQVRLPTGKTQLATTFSDDQERALCSAIYATQGQQPKAYGRSARLRLCRLEPAFAVDDLSR